MARLLFALALAALSAVACADARDHIHTSSASAAPTPTPSTTPTPAPTPSANATAARAALTGQIVGSSTTITNATLTTCTKESWTFTEPDAPFVSVHFSKFAVLAGDVVTIATPDGSTSTRVRAPAGSTTQFSSPRIPGPTAVVTFTPKTCLTAVSRTIALEVDAFEFTYKTSRSSTSRSSEDREICGASNQNKPAVCFKHATNTTATARVYTTARAVARLLKRASAGGPQIACTGFLLGSDGHVMTNHHCIKDAAEANATTFEFMVQAPTCDTNATTATNPCRQLGDCAAFGKVESVGADFVFANARLDYAIVKLRSKACVVIGKYGFVALRAKAPVKGEPIYVVQYPNGGGKMITMQQDVDKGDDGDDDDDVDVDAAAGDSATNSNSTSKAGGLEQAVVAAVNDENALGDFWTSYYADTEGGSSGSPVLSLTDHSVLALHANGACKNSGTPSHLLIEDIKKNKLVLPEDAFA